MIPLASSSAKAEDRWTAPQRLAVRLRPTILRSSRRMTVVGIPTVMRQTGHEAESGPRSRAVTDPELDQSIVDLGFVTRVSVEAGRVAVDFGLPTFWCSANFAWMIAEDMMTALSRLAWAKDIRVRLLDHFAAKKINAGIAADAGFAAAFAGEATGDLAAVRRTFAERRSPAACRR